MNPGFFLLKTVVHLLFVFAKRPLQVPWCSVNSVETFFTAAVLQRLQILTMAKPGCARYASGRGNLLWTRSCPCWPHCKGFVCGCQKETLCVSSLRGRCNGSTKFSRPAQRDCLRMCRQRSVEIPLIDSVPSLPSGVL